jgi:aminoglycoside phosphotransferase (APT) family kinase protein
MAGQDVVETAAEASRLEQRPLIVVEPLRAFLDQLHLGVGRLTATPIGGGHSNVTYALDRQDERFVLRRPPRGPLPRSAHDMVREARLLTALNATGARVPEVLTVCEDAEVIGAPFYVMKYINGHVLDDTLPASFVDPSSGVQVAEQLVDALVELHAVAITGPELASFGRPHGYLERQLRRFSELLEVNATRPLPELELVHAWLQRNIPPTPTSTVVHGDFRLGNMMFAAPAPPRILAVLDWEMATLGDPLADVGYMTAMWAESADPPDPMLDLSEVTRLPGFPDRATVARRYAERTGRDLSNLRWYQTLAIWKAAIFLESSYKRHLAGTTHDPYFARLKNGVPLLARRALRASSS